MTKKATTQVSRISPAELAMRFNLAPTVSLEPTTRAEERAAEYIRDMEPLLDDHAKGHAGATAKALRPFLVSLAAAAFIAGHDAASGRSKQALVARMKRQARRREAQKRAVEARWNDIRAAFEKTSESLTKNERVAQVSAKLDVSRATIFRALQDAE